ncbi:MAG: hypothetical protein ABIF71_09850 [Planctomycetota bacterium]
MRFLTAFLVCVLCVGIVAPAAMAGETVSNGAVSMFSIGNGILGILLHADKKLLVYEITDRTLALKGVRTYHYDGQFARTISTLKMEGTYPLRGRLIDTAAAPFALYEDLFKKEEYTFDPKYKVPGLAEKSSGGGGDLALLIEKSTSEGLLVILDAKNAALLVYVINKQKIQFVTCRSIMMEAQIPLFFPAANDSTVPTALRRDLVEIAKDFGPKDKQGKPNRDLPEGGVGFEVVELPYVDKILKGDDAGATPAPAPTPP